MSIFEEMALAIKGSSNRSFVAEVYMQVIKYHDHPDVAKLRSQELCKKLELPAGYISEIARARKIAPRVIASGVDPQRI